MNEILSEDYCNQKIGWQLKSIRQMRRMTQKTLAHNLNKGITSIQRYEDGAVGLSATQIYQLSILFSIPVGYFFCEEDDVHIAHSDRNTIKVASVLADYPKDVRNAALRFLVAIGDSYKESKNKERYKIF